MAEIRRIETREDIEKKDRRNKIIIGIILVGVMLLSTAGYAFFGGEKLSNGAKKTTYNGFEFSNQGDYWATQISGKNFYFSYLPNETGKTDIKKSLLDYTGKPLYFVNDDLAVQEISRNFEQFVERIQLACIQGENCTGNLPIKNCSSNVIIIEEADNANIVRAEDNCVYILSNETVKAADAFLYKTLGII